MGWGWFFLLGSFIILSHRLLIQLDCLLCFSSGKFEQYRGRYKLWQNIDFIALIIGTVDPYFPPMACTIKVLRSLITIIKCVTV